MSKKILSMLLAIILVVSLLPVAKAEATNTASRFSDMPDNWATEALESAVENGLLLGDNGKIMHDSPLTRAQMATIIVRAFAATEEGDLSTYSDVKSTNWFASSMAKAYKMGVIQGYDGKMSPNDNITREQAFAVLARALKLTPANGASKTFEDANKISDWARGEVYALVNSGYIQGENGKLNPQSNISRAEFAQVMYNLIKQYISEAGEYTEVADGNIMINVPGVTLKNLTINGDLIVGDGVGDGDLILDDVTVMGRILVRGGGVNTIYIKGGSSIDNIIIARVDGKVRVVIEDGLKIENVLVDGLEDVILEGEFGTVTVLADNIIVDATKATIAEKTLIGNNSKIISKEEESEGGGTVTPPVAPQVSAITITTDSADVTALDNDATVTVTLTTDTDGAKIYYTTDGSNPAASSTKTEYTVAFDVTKGALGVNGGDVVIKAIGVKSGYTNSEVKSKTITFLPAAEVGALASDKALIEAGVYEIPFVNQTNQATKTAWVQDAVDALIVNGTTAVVSWNVDDSKYDVALTNGEATGSATITVTEEAAPPGTVFVTSSITNEEPNQIYIRFSVEVELGKENFTMTKNGSPYTDFYKYNNNRLEYYLIMDYAAVFGDVFTVTVTDQEHVFSGTEVANNVVPSSDKYITSFIFEIDGVSYDGTINTSNYTIAVEVPHGTNVSNLTPTIDFVGDRIEPAIGPTDFTNLVKYTVYAEDGTDAQYSVTVTVADPVVPDTFKVTLAGDAEEGTDYTIAGADDLDEVEDGTELTITAITDITVDGDDVAANDTKKITITADTTITINKQVVAPETFTITFAVTPADADVEVKDDGGQIVAAESDGSYELEAGDYSYTVSKAGYDSATDSFTVSKDETITVVLQETAPTYAITFVAASGAESLDGATIKVYSDAARENEVADYSAVEAGTYYYTITKAGFNELQDSVVVTDDDVEVEVTLVVLTPAELLAIALGVDKTAVFDNEVKLTGDVAVDSEVEVADGVILNIEGNKLTVEEDGKLTVNGSFTGTAAGGLEVHGTIYASSFPAIAEFLTNGGEAKFHAGSTLQVFDAGNNRVDTFIGKDGDRETMTVDQGHVSIKIHDSGFNLTIPSGSKATIKGYHMDGDEDGYRIAKADMYTVEGTLNINYRTEVSGKFEVKSGGVVNIAEDTELYIFEVEGGKGSLWSDGTVTGSSGAQINNNSTENSFLNNDHMIKGIYTWDTDTQKWVAPNPILVEIDVYKDVQDVEVDFGTQENDAKAALAQKIKIKDSYDEYHEVSLDWSFDSTYEPYQVGEYDATGTFALPEGIDNTNELPLKVTATVTVVSIQYQSMDPSENSFNIEVDYGTTKEDAKGKLENSVKLFGKKNHDHESQVSINWTIANYNANQAGEYTATGTLGPRPAGWQGIPESVTATVTVKPQPVVEDVTITATVMGNPYVEGTELPNEEGVTVALATATGGAEIYYTLDGTTPTKENGTKFTESFVVDKNFLTESSDGGIVVLKAIAIKDGYTDSAMATLEVKFAAEVPKYTVTFSVVGGNGELKAQVESPYPDIESGAEIEEGTKIVFTATPEEGYQVKEWKVNNVVVGDKNSTYTLENLDADVNVTVEFEDPNPEMAYNDEDGNLTVTVLKGELTGTPQTVESDGLVTKVLDLAEYKDGENFCAVIAYTKNGSIHVRRYKLDGDNLTAEQIANNDVAGTGGSSVISDISFILDDNNDFHFLYFDKYGDGDGYDRPDLRYYNILSEEVKVIEDFYQDYTDAGFGYGARVYMDLAELIINDSGVPAVLYISQEWRREPTASGGKYYRDYYLILKDPINPSNLVRVAEHSTYGAGSANPFSNVSFYKNGNNFIVEYTFAGTSNTKEYDANLTEVD